MRKAKSLDQLYEEVKGYDVVLTADVGLADALNRRLDQTKLGPFAVTPRRYAFDGDIDFEKDVFLRLVNDLDLTWKHASFILGKVLSCWEETGEAEKILEYEEYSTDRVEDIVEKIQEYDTPFSAIEENTAEGEVAVVNFYQFNELDKKILPEEYDNYSIFADEEVEVSEFNVYESGLELVKSLIENVKTVGPENTGIAVHPDSRYQNLLESYFNSEDLKYVTQDEVETSEKFRVLISVMRTGLSDMTVRVRDVKPVTDTLGIETSSANLNARLESVDGLEEFKEFLNVVEFLEISQVIEKLETISGDDFTEVRELIDELGLINKPVNQENMEKILSFVENFDIVAEEENQGVLLVDPRKSSTVDRPVVFMVGMDAEWSQKVDMEPWRDKEKVEQRRVQNFESLIQSGDKTVFMVEDAFMEREIMPCHYFDELEGIESLKDHRHTERSAEASRLDSGFEKTDTEIEGKEFFLSQSSLNNLVTSPRVFYMSKLVSDIEEEDMVKGTLFHDFAELYFNRPDETRERLDEITDIFIEKIRPVTDDISLKKTQTEVKIGLKRLMSFLEDKESYIGEGYKRKQKYPNEFSEELGIEIETNSTEMSFNDEDLKITGTVDLITSDNHLIDYKSGRKFTAKQIVKKSRVKTAAEQRYPDLQALMYITQHSKKKEGSIKFSFVYFLEDLGEELSGEETDDISSTVTYYPEKFGEKASEIEIFESLFNSVKKSNKRRKTLEKMGYGPYENFLNEREFPEAYSKEELLETGFANDFISLCVENVGDYKYVKKGAKSALGKLIEFRNTNFFQEDVEEFKEFIEEKREELQRFEEKGYPIGDREVSDLPKKDLVIED